MVLPGVWGAAQGSEPRALQRSPRVPGEFSSAHMDRTAPKAGEEPPDRRRENQLLAPLCVHWLGQEGSSTGHGVPCAERVPAAVTQNDLQGETARGPRCRFRCRLGKDQTVSWLTGRAGQGSGIRMDTQVLHHPAG